MIKKGIESYSAFNDKESQKYLAANWPKGKLTAKRYDSDSIIYKFILCLSTVVKVFVGQMYNYVKNKDIDKADELLTEWETSIKIPDEIPRQDTLAARRRAVKQLISKLPVYNFNNGPDIDTTYEQYIYNLTGINVEITTAKTEGIGSEFELEFEVVFGISGGEGNFLWIVKVPVEGTPPNNTFPLKFPVSFFQPKIPDATVELLDLVLERVVPSFCDWQYEAVII